MTGPINLDDPIRSWALLYSMSCGLPRDVELLHDAIVLTLAKAAGYTREQLEATAGELAEEIETKL